MTRTSPRPTRSTTSAPALVTAPRVTLNREERAILDEALEHCHEASDEIQSRLGELGIKLMRTVFAGDVEAALDGRGRVWQELQERAGGPTLRLNGKTLSVAVRLAAWDKRIADDRWRLLDVGRKERLLPLGEATLLRDGAKHVAAMKMTQRATSRYVHEKLRELRPGAALSRLTPARVVADLRRLRERYTDKGARSRMKSIARDPEGRATVAAALQETMELLRLLQRDLRS